MVHSQHRSGQGSWRSHLTQHTSPYVWPWIQASLPKGWSAVNSLSCTCWGLFSRVTVIDVLERPIILSSLQRSWKLYKKEDTPFNLINYLNPLTSLCVCMCAWVCVPLCVCPCAMYTTWVCGGQIAGSQLCPSTMEVMGIELRLPDLVTRTSRPSFLLWEDNERMPSFERDTTPEITIFPNVCSKRHMSHDSSSRCPGRW